MFHKESLPRIRARLEVENVVRNNGRGMGDVCLSGTRTVGFHLTPLVFLTDTFTGKWQCGFK